MTPIRTRFAPSPTGAPHIGNIRTALFAWLFAQHHEGTFLLRIEDTDQTRLQEGSIEAIIDSLHWLGITIDEGVMSADGREKGLHGPYIQSQRLSIYHHHIQHLLETGAAYPCICTKERLDELKKQQEIQNMPPGYDGACRTCDIPIQKKLQAIGTHPIRLAMPQEGIITFEDSIRGIVSFDLALQDDPIILKSDGFPTYHLASVVDDHEMTISHVIRGEEWISSTPKHIVLYQAFRWDQPVFAHLPMILGRDKSKLSKRHGAQSVLEYKQQGYPPQALMNFLALLGWNPGTDQEIFSKNELINAFSLNRVQKSPAIFNTEKLDWLSHHYITTLPDTQLLETILPWLKQAGCPIERYSQDQLLLITKIAQQRISAFSKVGEEVNYLWDTTPLVDASILIDKKSSAEKTLVILNAIYEFFHQTELSGTLTVETISQSIEQWREKQGYGRGEILWPLRVAVTRLKNSPGVYETICVIGLEETRARIDQGRKLLETFVQT